MRKKVLAVFALVVCLAITKQVIGGTNTSNLSLYKPSSGETGWATTVNNNFDTLDTAVGTNINANGSFKSSLITTLSEEGTPVTGDYLMLYDTSEGALNKVNFSEFSGGVGGGDVSTTDIDTFAELDAIVADASLAKTSGTLTNGNCAEYDASGNLVDSGGACGGVGGSSEWSDDGTTLTTADAGRIVETDGTMSIGTSTPEGMFDINNEIIYVNTASGIQDAINVIEAKGTGFGKGGHIHIMSGSYSFTSPITITGDSSIKITGNSQGTVLNFLAEDLDGIVIGSTATQTSSPIIIEDIFIIGNSLLNGDGNNAGSMIKFVNHRRSRVKNVRIYGGNVGVHLLGDGVIGTVYNNIIEGCTIGYANRAGVLFETTGTGNNNTPAVNANIVDGGLYTNSNVNFLFESNATSSGKIESNKIIGPYLDMLTGQDAFVMTGKIENNQIIAITLDGEAEEIIALDSSTKKNTFIGYNETSGTFTDSGFNNTFFSNEGSFTGGNNRDFNLFGQLRIFSPVVYRNALDDFYSANPESSIYGTDSSGSEYPFQDAGHLVLQSRASGADRDIVFVTGSTPSVKAVIDGSGNFGIGDSTPDALMDIAGTMFVEVICDESGLNCSDVSAGLASGSSELSDDGTDLTTVDTGRNLVLDSNLTVDTNTLYVDSNDNHVGIGTTTPTENLHIYGIAVDVELESVNNARINMKAGGNQENSINFYENGTARGQIRQEGTDNNLYIDSSSIADILMNTVSSGNVGIGNASPSEKLDVTGTIKATYFEGDGSALTGISGGSGTPGGSDTQVQFNDGGSAFGGDAGMVYNKTTDTLTVANIVATTSLQNSGTGQSTTPDLAVSGTLVIPVNGTTDANGEITQDTTSGQLQGYNDSQEVVWAEDTKQMGFTILAPTSSTSFTVYFPTPSAVTIQSIVAYNDAGTATVTYYECSDLAGNTCSTDITGAMSVTTTTTPDTSHVNAGIAAGYPIEIRYTALSSAGQTRYKIQYTIDAD